MAFYYLPAIANVGSYWVEATEITLEKHEIVFLKNKAIHSMLLVRNLAYIGIIAKCVVHT